MTRKQWVYLLAFGAATMFVYAWRWFQVNEISGFLRLVTYLMLLADSVLLISILSKKKMIIITNFVVVFLLLLIVETTLFFVRGLPAAEKKDFPVMDFDEKHIVSKIGNVMYPDTILNGLKIENGDTLYNVKYTIGSNFHRITPGNHDSLSKYALFFGCSIAFGEGLEDDQTFPYYVQQFSKTYHSYNRAQSGTATNYMLAQLKELDLRKDVKEKDGKAFYIFFWDHIYRSLGTMDRHVKWMHLSPNFERQDRKIIRNKLFKTGRPIRSWFYEHVYETNIVKYFELDFPLSINHDHIDFVADLILESKKAYKKQFGNDDFSVVFYPSYIQYTKQDKDYFCKALAKRNITLIDLTTSLNYGSANTIGIDPHPNAKTNAYLAKTLLKKLN
jgi:hypothetical protein